MSFTAILAQWLVHMHCTCISGQRSEVTISAMTVLVYNVFL